MSSPEPNALPESERTLARMAKAPIAAPGGPSGPDGPSQSAHAAWSAFDAVDTAIAVCRRDGTVVFANALLADLTATPLEVIVGGPVFRLLDAGRREELKRLHAAALVSPDPQRADVGPGEGPAGAAVSRVALRRWQEADEPFVVWSLFGAVPRPRDDNPFELALRGTEVGLWDWNVRTDTITWINDWCEHWGFPPFSGSIDPRTWAAQPHPDDLPSYRIALEDHLSGRTPALDVEYRLRNRHGDRVWVRERGRAVERDATGRAMRVVGLCLHVDARHRTAQALVRSESKFQLAVWATQVGFWDIDVATGKIEWGYDWCASLDIGPREATLDLARWGRSIHPDDCLAMAGYADLVAGRIEHYEAEYRLQTRTGGWRWVLSRGRATARDGSGSALRVAGVTFDIDARKRAELALREAETQLETAIWGGDIGMWAKGSDGQFRFLNDWCERVDIDHCNGPNQTERWRARIHPQDVERHAETKDNFYRGGADQYDIEYRVRTRGGQWRWLLERGKVLERGHNGAALRIVGVCLNIDNHKRTEAALQDAEARYELAVHAARLPVWEYDAATGTVLGNAHWHRVAGCELTESGAGRRSELWMSDVHPEDAPQYAGILAAQPADEAGFYQNEYRIRLPTGEDRWLLDRARVVERDATGMPLKVIGISVDIHAQKELQASLRRSQAQLETAIAGSDLGLWDWNLETDAVVWLSDWPEHFGIDVRGSLPRRQDWLARVHPDDVAMLDPDTAVAFGGAQDDMEREYRVRTGAGEYRWIQVRSKIVERDRSGRARRVVGACIDVDARRRAEEQMRTQAEILATMSEGVVLIDLGGRMELTNPAFQHMFRGAPGDLLGGSIADLLAAGPAHQLQGGPLIERWLIQRGPSTAVFRRRDGTEFTGEFVIASITLAGGQRLLVVVQDVSERKRLEQEVLDISNRERRRIGHELHDGLCQELTGIALMLGSIATDLRRDILPTHHQLTEMAGLVNAAIEGARAMARGLSPVTIDRGGLLFALDLLVRRARESSGIDVRLRVRMPENWRFAEASASHLYRIAQEALNNAVKHADARAITVSLQAADARLELSVADNGRGLPVRPGPGSGMGLKIMDYRARMIGGSIEIAARRGGGTRIRCVCASPARDREGHFTI